MDNFYLTLPSNVVSDQYDNTVANFTTKLASRIELSGKWEVGLAAISYTRSWYNISKYDYIKLRYYKNNTSYEHKINSDLLIGRYDDIEKLIECLNELMGLAMNYILNRRTKRDITLTKDEKQKIKEQSGKDTVLKAKLTLDAINSKFISSNQEITDTNSPNIPRPEAFRLDQPIRHELGGYRQRLSNDINHRTNPYYVKKVLTSLTTHPKFKFDEKTRKVTFLVGLIENTFVYPDMSENLSQMLGFNKSELDNIRNFKFNQYEGSIEKGLPISENLPENSDELTIKRTHMAEQPYDLTAGYHSLYVYCDIVRPSFIGNAFAQLLRFVEIPTNSKYGDQIVLTYPDTHYIPVMTKEFETIEIAIKNDIGQLMPFEFGRSIIVLHFRRINKSPE